MHTITIDTHLYKEAEKYAKKHNISVRELVERFLSRSKHSEENSTTEYMSFDKAMDFVKTLSAKGGKPVPADGRGIEALLEEKYAL